MKTNWKNAIAMCSALGLLAAPIPASAGLGSLGGLAKRALGVDSSVSSTDGEAFLTDAAKSTKNVMLSAVILSGVLQKKLGSAGLKAQISTVQGLQNWGEIDAHKSDLESSFTVLNGRTDLAGDLGQAYETSTKEQRKLIAIAVANLAIGVVRNTELVGKAPGMVKGVASNPQLLNRLGQFKTAASLVAMQGKGLGSIAGSMPKLLRAVKVEMPKASATNEPQQVDPAFF